MDQGKIIDLLEEIMLLETVSDEEFEFRLADALDAENDIVENHIQIEALPLYLNKYSQTKKPDTLLILTRIIGKFKDERAARALLERLVIWQNDKRNTSYRSELIARMKNNINRDVITYLLMELRELETDDELIDNVFTALQNAELKDLLELAGRDLQELFNKKELSGWESVYKHLLIELLADALTRATETDE